jgi:hypothetical protein
MVHDGGIYFKKGAPEGDAAVRKLFAGAPKVGPYTGDGVAIHDIEISGYCFLQRSHIALNKF